MLKLQWCVMHSVRRSQLRKIKSCSVSWSTSRSTLSRTERSTCSSASSCLKWRITLNNGMIIAETSGTSSQASSAIRETLRRCSGSLKVMIDIIWCCQSQSISLGRRMDGSGHCDSQMSSQALNFRSFMRFTCSTGSVMPSITCTTSGWLTASCSTVTPRQVMEDTTSTQGHSEAKSKTSQKCQRSEGQGSSGSSSIRIQRHTRIRSSTRRSSFTSSSHSIRSGSGHIKAPPPPERCFLTGLFFGVKECSNPTKRSVSPNGTSSVRVG